MYITIFCSLIGFIYLFYKTYTIFRIDKSLTFQNNKELNSKIISIKSINNNGVIINEKINNTNKYTINNCDYIIIDYTLNNNKYKLVEKNNIFSFPFYNKIKSYPFINKITKIELINNDNIMDLTDKLIIYIGPNYDFNYSYSNCILKVEDYLKILKINYNNSSVLKIYDSFDNIQEFLIHFILKWKPMLLN